MIPKPYFWRIALTVFVLMAIINYLPAFSGNVPFPGDHVLRHSAWEGYARSGPPQQTGQLIDVVAMFYPFRALLSRATHAGELPLWNPYIMGGAPFQANSQSALFSPLNLLYIALPLKVAWTANLLIRPFLAAVFMTMFVRIIGGSELGSILAGVLFALSGFIVQWQGESNGDSAFWLPLMCYGVYRVYQKLNGRSIAIAAFAFAMPVLAGHPETAAHSTAFACVMALFLSVKRFEPKFIWCFALVGVLALGLAAVQLIPTLEWFGQLGLHVEAAQPVLDRHQGQGFFSRDILRDPSSAGVSIPEGSAYVGMLGLLAASFAVFHPNRRYVWFLIVSAGLATAIAFGIQPVRWIIVHLPVIKAMKNGRLILIVDFALAALAGLGVGVLESQLETLNRRRRAFAFAFLAAAFLILSFCVYEVHRATLSAVEFWRSPWGSLIFLIAGFGVIAARLLGLLKDRVFPIAILGLAGLEMLTFSFGFLGFTPAKDVFPSLPVFDFLKSEGAGSSTFRVAKERVPIPHDAGILYGFEAADGYDLTTERIRLFTADLAENREDGVMFLAENILGARDRRFDMLNVKYLLVSAPGPQVDLIAQHAERFQPVFSQRGVAVFENTKMLPRAFAVPLSGVEVIPDLRNQLARIKESAFDPERSVVFEEDAHVPTDSSEAPNARIQIAEHRNNEYLIRTHAAAAFVMVLSQTYYPGWKATIDGISAPVHPVDVALTGVVVPAGTRSIRLSFSPPSFQFGAALSLISLAVFTVLLIPKRNISNGV